MHLYHIGVGWTKEVALVARDSRQLTKEREGVTVEDGWGEGLHDK